MRANLPETLAVVFFCEGPGLSWAHGMDVWYSRTGAFFENVDHDVRCIEIQRKSDTVSLEWNHHQPVCVEASFVIVRLHLHRKYLQLAIVVSPTNWPIQKLNHFFTVTSYIPSSPTKQLYTCNKWQRFTQSASKKIYINNNQTLHQEETAEEPPLADPAPTEVWWDYVRWWWCSSEFPPGNGPQNRSSWWSFSKSIWVCATRWFAQVVFSKTFSIFRLSIDSQ